MNVFVCVITVRKTCLDRNLILIYFPIFCSQKIASYIASSITSYGPHPLRDAPKK